MNVHFSSKTDEWATPSDFFEMVDHSYGPFDCDVCANAANARAALFYTKKEDGLKQDWKGHVWMNPPYGRAIGKWVKKAYESSLLGATVVCLLPARTDTSWWHDYVSKGEITFLRGRLKFGGCKNPAPFPSALVVFRPAMNEELWCMVCGKLFTGNTGTNYMRPVCPECAKWRRKQ